jgi:uncharacterized membrane protein
MQIPVTGPSEPDSSRRRLSHLNDYRSYQPSQAGRLQHYKTNGASRDQRLAKALGWFSIGLGMAQLLAPRVVSRATGVADHPVLVRAVGVREIASGVGILSQRRPTGWLWTRVAGDAMDLALLGMAANSQGARRNRVAVASVAVAGVTALDVLTSVRQTRRESTAKGVSESDAAYVEKSITVNRSPDECYRLWRDFENFPRFMKHLESVQVTGDNRTHWKAKAPLGASVEWDAQVTVDQPGQLLAWHSVEGSEVDNAGTVRFERAPGGRGTIVWVEMQYSPPGGKAGAVIARLFGEEPSRQLDEDLRRFKWLIETGEIPTTVGQPSGRRDPITRLLLRKGAPG